MKTFLQRYLLLLVITAVVVFDAVVFLVYGLNALSATVYCLEAAAMVIVLSFTLIGGVKFRVQFCAAICIATIVLFRPIETQQYYTIFFLTYGLRIGLEGVLNKIYDTLRPIMWLTAIFVLFQGLRVRLVPEVHLLQLNPLDDVFGIWLIFFGVLTLRWALKATQKWKSLNLDLELKGKELSFTKGALALTTHHLKNPLATATLAMGGARLGRRSNGKIEIDQATFDRIESAINRSAIMVNELVENQNAIYRFQSDEISLNEVVESTREEFEGKVEFHLSTSKINLSATVAFVLRLAITTHLNNSIEHGGDEIALFTSKDQILIKDNGVGLPRNYSNSYGKQVIGSKANRGMGAYQTSVLLDSVGWKQELLLGQGFGIKIAPKTVENTEKKEVGAKVPLKKQIY